MTRIFHHRLLRMAFLALMPATLLTPLLGQTPTISGVSIHELDTSSFQVFYTINGALWSDLRYGTTSGQYPYRTKSINCYNTATPCQYSGGKSVLTITALAPATTYYVRVTARPNPSDDTNICSTSICGSTELVVTTLPAAASTPLPPKQWRPTAVDTSSYVVISLQPGSGGECQAAASVASRDGWSVSAGDTVEKILLEIGYGAVIEIPPGVACLVPPKPPGGSDLDAGYVLPGKPLDSGCGGPCAMTDPRHRWIVFRTRQSADGDFPPFGARIDPSYAPKLGKFYSAQPNKYSQLFTAYTTAEPVHHFWWQNVEFEDDPNYTDPSGSVDPVGFQYFVQVGSSWKSGNNQFIVFDRVYAHGPGAPVRHITGYELGGNYQAMIGCYTSQVEAWRMKEYPSYAGTVSSSKTLLSIPKNTFRLSANSPLLGMTGPATVVLSSVLGVDKRNSPSIADHTGLVIGNLYKDHLEIQYSGLNTISCTGCTLVKTADPITPTTALKLFSGVITKAGFFSGISWNNAEWQSSRYIMAFGILFSDLQGPSGPYLFDNNYLDGVGEGFYVDPQYSNYGHDDITYLRNHQIWPKNAFSGDPQNLWRYNVRQHFESKRGRRYEIKGNLFSHSWSYQNDGPAIFISSRPTYIAQNLDDGVSDVNIESNTISHGRTGVVCQDGDAMDNAGFQFEPAAARRVTITNNLMFDLGRWKYCDSVQCPSLGSFYFENRPGCQDLVITNNTGDVTYGEIPALLYLGGGEMLSNHMTFQNNILHLSQGLAGYGGGSFGDWPLSGIANHEVSPAAVYSVNGSAPKFKDNLDASFVVTKDKVTPDYTWSKNVLIGGFIGNDAAHAVDMTYAQVVAYSANMPAGDIYPTGDTIAARQVAAGLDTTTWRSSVYNPQGIGADIDRLISDMGIVSRVQVPIVTSNTATFTYFAPDSRACVVDVSSNGSNWLRTQDAGGQRSRTVAVTGLSPATNYTSRIVCYYGQKNDGVLYTDYSADQITSGSFSTMAAGH